MYRKSRKILAVLLTMAVLCSGNSIAVSAQDLPQTTEGLGQTAVETEEIFEEETDADSDAEIEVPEETETEISQEPGLDTEEAEAEEIQNIQEETADGAQGLFSDGVSAGTEGIFTAEEESQPETEAVDVCFSVSHDADFISQGGKLSCPVCLTKLRVPYFDLALYGMQNLYLSPGKDENGNRIPGTVESARNKVTMLHLFIYATEVLYCGVSEENAGKGYLKEQGILGSDVLRYTGSAGSIYFTQFWGMDQNFNYYLNYEYPVDSPGLGATADQIVLSDEDVITVGHFSDWGFYSDPSAGFNYLKIDSDALFAEADKSKKNSISIEVYRTGRGEQYMTEQKKLTGEYKLYYTPADELRTGRINTWKYIGTTDENGNLSVDLKDFSIGKYFIGIEGQPGQNTGAVCSAPGGVWLDVTEKEHVFDEGKVTKEPTCAEEGEKIYTCSNCGATRTEKIARTDKHTYDKGVVTKKATYTATGVKTYTCTVCNAIKTETIPVVKHSHKYVWKTISKATVFQPQKQKGTCSLCKKTVTRNYGSKLKATIKLNVSSVTLQKKQATKRVRVSMANGDSIRSWVSSNRKIVTVDKNGLIRAQNRNGSAKITVTLKSGKRAVLKVKVQSGKVRTTKISGLKSSMTLKKGQKTTLKPVISPLTSTEKVTYVTSNKKIATVFSKGVITAKKKGTAKITVRSGKKSYMIKVTVK